MDSPDRGAIERQVRDELCDVEITCLGGGYDMEGDVVRRLVDLIERKTQEHRK